MKKVFVLMLILLLLPGSALAAPPDGPKVICRAPGQYGDYLSADVKPFIDNGRMMVPLRAVSETLGFTVQWDAQNSKVTIAGNDKNVVLSIGSCEAVVNGTSCPLDVPARIVSNRTYVPIRFVSENLGYNVYYIHKNETAFITYDKLITNEEIQEIFDNRSNFISYPESPILELESGKVLPSGIGLGDTWAMVKNVYGQPLKVFVSDKEIEAPDDNAINQAEKIMVVYSSAFTPYSGDVSHMRFYFNKGMVEKAEVSFTW